MAERAYSSELKRDISAKSASNMAVKGELTNQRAFFCIDPSCRIPMTCTNWYKTKERNYFTPSSLDKLHNSGCSELSKKDVKEPEGYEIELAKDSIRKNGLIKMTKSVGKAKSNDKQDSIAVLGSETKSQSANFNNTFKSEARHVYPIASFIDLFEDAELDKDKKIISIGNEIISLNELFIESKNKDFKYECIRIFYGEAYIQTATIGKNMLVITFIDSKLPKFYSNIKSVSKKKSTSDLKRFLDKNKKVLVYYRAKLVGKGTKFESFNESVYKDIYF